MHRGKLKYLIEIQGLAENPNIKDRNAERERKKVKIALQESQMAVFA